MEPKTFQAVCQSVDFTEIEQAIQGFGLSFYNKQEAERVWREICEFSVIPESIYGLKIEETREFMTNETSWLVSFAPRNSEENRRFFLPDLTKKEVASLWVLPLESTQAQSEYVALVLWDYLYPRPFLEMKEEVNIKKTE